MTWYLFYATEKKPFATATSLKEARKIAYSVVKKTKEYVDFSNSPKMDYSDGVVFHEVNFENYDKSGEKRIITYVTGKRDYYANVHALNADGSISKALYEL